MKQEKSFVEQELERERNSTGLDISWKDRVRRFFLRRHDEPVRTAAEERRDEITEALCARRYSISADDFIKAAQVAADAQNRFDEYIWTTTSNDPAPINIDQVRRLSSECDAARARVAAEGLYYEAIKAMQNYGR